jgi:hypothetical protein
LVHFGLQGRHALPGMTTAAYNTVHGVAERE